MHGSARLVNHTDMAHSPNFIGQLLMAEEFTPLILIAGTQSEFGSLDNFTQALTALDSVRLILLSVWIPCRRLREPLVEAGSDYRYARCRQSMTADDSAVRVTWAGLALEFFPNTASGKYVLPKVDGKTIDVNP